jgi:hypothetical protein
MNENNRARFYMKYDKNENILTIEVTQEVAFRVMKSLRFHLWPEIENMTLETINHISEDGYEYKNVRRYKIHIYEDRVSDYFEAAHRQLTESIKSSIVNSDN